MPVPPEPYINLQTGSLTGTLAKGQPFYWYNPTTSNVTVGNAGTWCTPGSCEVAAGSWTEVTILNVPNPYAFAFTESPNVWNTPGMPHISTPPSPVAVPGEERERDVA